MVSRYDDRPVGINRTEQYQEMLDDKNVNHIKQYFSPKLRHPTAEEVSNLELIQHEWKLGDRYFKLANQYYGDSKLWWVIAWFNQRPTESHVTIGETIEIPLPLERVLKLLRV